MTVGKEPSHVPVLLNETLALLSMKEDGVYVDATVGLGGHAVAILSRIGKAGRLIGFDRDEEALGYARSRIGNNRVSLVKGAFSRMGEMLTDMGIGKVDGVVFDLGVSMLQFSERQRGFSFQSDAPLDMRMDTSQDLTAEDVVNSYPEKELERIIREFGEEPYARRIARAIVTARTREPIATCASLAKLVAGTCKRRGRIHPATRTFQALRIEVNKELEELGEGLKSAGEVLKPGGRMCVISYHSLEDRMVKNFLRKRAMEGLLRIVTKKPITPGIEEMRRNPSSRSAKLRGGERI